jgi:Trypsin-like peptidase domain/Effector-associated domain 1
MSQLRLTGPQIQELAGLLRAAFPRPRFKEFLLYRLDRSLDDYTGPADDYRTMLRDILVEANAQLWWRNLVSEARKAVPADPGLQAFSQEFGYSPSTVSVANGGAAPVRGPQLELKIKESSSTFDILTWRTRLGEIEGRICRVEFPEGEAQGTGFLIGPNAVVTNYHVIEEIKNGNIPSGSVRLRFDYKVIGGVAVQAGTVYKLSKDWLFDSSPYSSLDALVLPHADPGADELDYAILRVDGTPGTDPVGGATNDPQPVPRQWLEVPPVPHDFSKQPALYIVQHPDGKPMQVAIDSNGVVGVNGNRTRVRYTTTTEPGSSGSPCFGPDWQWIALHHSGDPKYYKGAKPEFNEGIPLPAICSLLKDRGKASVFGESC